MLAMATASEAAPITLFLCGDVMTGRGLDQIMAQPSEARLFESYVHSAAEYVALAERVSGPIPRRVSADYIWGDAIAVLNAVRPDLRIVNLETAVTTSADAWPGKAIHYRMHPGNLPCLRAAGVDCCVLANNHVLDWGRAGLSETLASLREAGVATAGAGEDVDEATAPARFDRRGGARLLVFAVAHESSGVPRAWGAGRSRSGVWRLPDLSPRTVNLLATVIERHRRAGDIVMMSIHWGENWSYEVPPPQRRFAQSLIEDAGVDLVHGHSSHHAKGIEIHRERLILYGCGDLLNDYEGIGGYQEFLPGLGLMYFATLDPGGRLQRLQMLPTCVRRFRIEHATAADTQRLLGILQRECSRFSTQVSADADDSWLLRWG